MSEEQPISTPETVAESTAAPVEAFAVAMESKTQEEALAVLSETVDEYNAELVENLASQTPEVRFRHSSTFTDAEDKIIAAGIVSGIAMYKVAQSIHCSYKTLKAHIEKTPALLELLKEAILREQQDLEEAIADCVKARVPAVLMWKAERIMPEKYGTDRAPEQEDDTKIVIGAIPEEKLLEADRIIAEANASDDDTQLGAVADLLLGKGNQTQDPAAAERQKEMIMAGGEVADVPLAETMPAPALKPPKGDPNFSQYRNASPAPASFDDDDAGGGGDDWGGGMDVGDDFGGGDLW